MKKTLLFYLTAMMFASNVFSQVINVPKSKKALLMKSTATWCGPCGYYHSITDNIYNQHSDSILFINAHVSTSDVGDAYSGNFHNALNIGASGIPTYNISGRMLTNWPPVEKVMVDSARKFLKRPVIANVAFKYQITGAQLNVQTSVKFFAADNADEYYINVFVLENKISTSQNNGSTYVPLVQNRISRGPMMSGNSGMWGEKFATGNIPSGKFYDVSFSSTLKTAWVQNNLKFLAVIWEKENGVYTALSAEDVPSSSSTGISDADASDAIILYPNPVTDQVNIPVNGTGTISVYNSFGQLVLSKDFQRTSSDEIVRMNTAELNSGIYFLKLVQDGKIRTQRIIVQTSNL